MIRALINIPKERVFDADEKTIVLTLSDESIDRYNSIIYQDGWVLDNYVKNPGFHAYHIANWGNPDWRIGVSKKLWIENKTLYSNTFFEADAVFENTLARKLWIKYTHGTMSAVSVGFDPLEWRWGLKERGEDEDILYFTKHDLLEHSAVDIPANPNATVNNDFPNFYKEKEDFMIQARALKATGVQDPALIKKDKRAQMEWARSYHFLKQKSSLR